MTFLFGDQPMTEQEKNARGVSIIVNAIEDVFHGDRPTGRVLGGISGALSGPLPATEGLAAAVAQKKTMEERERDARQQLGANQPDMGRTDP